MINPATLPLGARLDVCEKSSRTNPPENKQCTFRFLKYLKRCTRPLASCHLQVCKNLLTCHEEIQTLSVCSSYAMYNDIYATIM